MYKRGREEGGRKEKGKEEREGIRKEGRLKMKKRFMSSCLNKSRIWCDNDI